VGGAFLVLAAVLWWRGQGLAPTIAATLGTALVAGGLLVPGRLGPVYRGWMGLAVLLSKVTTPVFLGVVYFGVITPMGLARRWVGRNPLVHMSNGAGFWKSRPSGERSSLEHQF
jgi:hypothetical protein